MGDSVRPGSWVLALLLLGSCGRKATPPHVDSNDQRALGTEGRGPPPDAAAAMTAQPAPLARMERTGCPRQCPAYEIEIWDNGTVHYEGRAHVKVTGRAEAQLPAAKLDRLRAAFEEERFTTLHPLPLAVIDLPTTILSYRTGDRMHVIRYLHATPALKRLEGEMEAIVDASRWVGSDAGQPTTSRGVEPGVTK